MAQITVTRQGDTFDVQTPAGTSHKVSVPAGFPADLGCGHVAPGELVRASFEFLLEREPATSILREFSLDVISQYFPGYPAEIRARLGSSHPGPPARVTRSARFGAIVGADTRYGRNGAVTSPGRTRLKPPIHRLRVLEAGMTVPFGVRARRRSASEWVA